MCRAANDSLRLRMPCRVVTIIRCLQTQYRRARWLVTAIVPGSPILVTLMMEAIRSFETSVLTRATRLNIPEAGILQRKLSHSFGTRVIPALRLMNR
jgi:hypothetical protein